MGSDVAATFRRSPRGSDPDSACSGPCQVQLGTDLRRWRELQRLTAQQVADRAGVSRPVVSRIENGRGATLENVLRVARALGVLDQFAGAVDPMATDVGRMRADEQRPRRVRPARRPTPDVAPAFEHQRARDAEAAAR